MNEQAIDEIATPELASAAAPLPLPSWRLVIALSLPVLAQQGLYFIVNWSDRFLAGHLKDLEGTDQLAVQAAQTTGQYLAWFINCYNVLVTVGSTALVARAIGAGDRRLAVAATHQSLILALLLGLAATAWAFLGGVPWMVYTLNLEERAAEQAVNFALVLFGLMVFQTLEAAGIACLVGAGDTRTGMWVMVGVALINLPLAWGFGWGQWGLPYLGFVGIALGTALSHVLGGLVVLIVLARGRRGLKLEPAQFWPRFDLLARLLRISVPAGLDSLSIVVGQFWFLSIINRFSDAAIGAHGIALTWEALGYLSGAAFGTAAMTLVGQNLGAQRPDQAARAGWMACGLGCVFMSVMGLTFYTFAPQMFTLFCPKPEQAQIITEGVPVLRLVAFAMPPLASAIIFTQALRGAGDTRVPVLFTWVGFFVVRIPLAYYVALSEFSLQLPVPLTDAVNFGPFEGLGHGLFGCWIAMVADIVVRGVFFFFRFAHGAWQHKRV